MSGNKPNNPASHSTQGREEQLYKGYGEQYTRIYNSKTREGKWEEDILEFANVFLNPYSGHPYITNRDITLGRLSTSVDVDSHLVNYYDENIKLNFIKGINSILKSIPNSSDKEILYMCHELTTTLKDGHTQLYPQPQHLDENAFIYPFQFKYMCNSNNECGYYCISTSPQNEKVINSRLISINGVPIDEIYARLSRIVVFESDEKKNGALIRDVLYYDDLVYLDIAKEEEAEFNFESMNGSVEKINVSPIGIYDALKGGMIQNKYNKGAFWCETDHSNEIIYAKLVQCLPYDTVTIQGEELYMTQSWFWNYIAESCECYPNYKLVVDFQGNGGGSVDLTLSELGRIKKSGNEVYVLVDEHVGSASSIMTLALKAYSGNCTIIGSPTAQGGHFLDSTFNPGFSFHFFPSVRILVGSTAYSVYKNEYQNTIIPDLSLCQRIEDYIVGEQTIINYINKTKKEGK